MTKWIATPIIATLLGGAAALPSRGQAASVFGAVPESTQRDLVKRLIAEHDFSQADEALAKLLRVAPDDRELLILQALNFFHERDYTKSRRIVDGLTGRGAATAEVRVLSGLLYVVANDLGAAEPEFRTATQADATNAAAHYYLGRTLYMRQAIDESIMELKAAIALDPDFIQAYDALGLAYVVQENPREAQTWFARGMHQEELRGVARMEWLRLDLAAMLLTHHKSTDAADYLADAQRINPRNPQVYTELGQMYFQEHRYSEALIAYGEVLKLDPYQATAHYFRGRAYHFLGQNKLSKNEFDLFTQLNRQHSMVDATSTVARSYPPGVEVR